MELTHFNDEGRAHMVDVGEKPRTKRIARAQARVYLAPETFRLVRDGGMKKGDVLAVAQVAGIMAAKKNSELIPMCHHCHNLRGHQLRAGRGAAHDNDKR